MSLDHKNSIYKYPEQKNDINNVWWMDTATNRIKNDLTHDEFLDICKVVYNKFCVIPNLV